MTDTARDIVRARAESLLAEHASIADAAKLLAQSELTPEQSAVLIALGARSLVAEIASQDRRPIPALVIGAPRKGHDDTNGLRSVANRTLLDTYRLCGGKPIGDATRDELIESAAQHEKIAAGNVREARFQRAVAKLVEGGGRVRERVSEIELRKMQSAANEAAT